MNIAARAARWSAANWKKATFGWLAFVLLAAALDQVAGVVKLTESELSNGESARAQATLERAGVDQSANEAVLVHDATLTAEQPAFTRVVDRVARSVAATVQVKDVRSALATGHSGGSPRTATRRSCSSRSAAARKPPRIACSRCSTRSPRSSAAAPASRWPSSATRAPTARTVASTTKASTRGEAAGADHLPDHARRLTHDELRTVEGALLLVLDLP